MANADVVIWSEALLEFFGRVYLKGKGPFYRVYLIDIKSPQFIGNAGFRHWWVIKNENIAIIVARVEVKAGRGDHIVSGEALPYSILQLNDWIFGE